MTCPTVPYLGTRNAHLHIFACSYRDSERAQAFSHFGSDSYRKDSEAERLRGRETQKGQDTPSRKPSDTPPPSPVGRTARGGALAPEPPRATRSTPEFRGARRRRARRRRAPTGLDQRHEDGANRGASLQIFVKPLPIFDDTPLSIFAKHTHSILFCLGIFGH